MKVFSEMKYPYKLSSVYKSEEPSCPRHGASNKAIVELSSLQLEIVYKNVFCAQCAVANVVN